METEKSIQKWIPLAAGILVLLAFTITIISSFVPTNHHFRNHFVLVYTLVINLIMVIGVILIAFYLFRQWVFLITHNNNLAEERAANIYKSEREKLNKMEVDAIERRVIEHERNQTNDLFRLIESAKETVEKSESIPNGDKSDKFMVRIIEKRESLDLDKLETLIQYYNTRNNNKPNTENHV